MDHSKKLTAWLFSVGELSLEIHWLGVLLIVEVYRVARCPAQAYNTSVNQDFIYYENMNVFAPLGAY